MLSILILGRQVKNGAYYIHPGDLLWWLYYPAPGSDPFSLITVWEEPRSPGSMIAWTLLSPNAQAFDVYIHPDWIRTAQARYIYAWSVEKLVALLESDGADRINFVWAAQSDDWLNSLLLELGFSRASEGCLNLQHSLKSRIPLGPLPPGYTLRSCTGEAELSNRAAAQYSAFGSHLPFDQYCQRLLHFFRSPVYQPTHDIVIQAPDGRIAAFCYLWFDRSNHLGFFEPVGVHQDFQRQGLGKLLIQEGLRRMQAEGMLKAMLNVDESNWAARRLYQSVGFKYIETLATFQKRIGPLPG